MNVSFLLPGYPWEPVGGFRVVYEYANQLVERGHGVTVVHPRRLRNWTPAPPPGVRKKLLVRAAKLAGTVVHPRPSWQYVDPRVKLKYVREPTPCLFDGADAVVATSWPTAEALAEMCPSAAPYYLIQHYEVWQGPADRVDATWRAPFTKLVIARWLWDKGVELGVPEAEMVHLPNAIEHGKFRLHKPIESRAPRVAMLYSELEWKGGPDGVRALELTRLQVPDFRAVLFGVAPRPRGLPAWIEYEQKPAQERLVEDIYNGSAIYLCPSWAEGWHLPPAEAMACGCALVSTDIGGVRDYATHGDNALLAPVGDAEALRSHLVRLLRSSAQREAMARRGAARIQRFTWDRSTTILEAVLHESRDDRQSLVAAGTAGAGA
jgi:L-malate glycosyltransferase